MSTKRILIVDDEESIQTVVRQFNDLGVSGVITKPFNSLDLPDQIVKMLDW